MSPLMRSRGSALVACLATATLMMTTATAAMAGAPAHSGKDVSATKGKHATSGFVRRVGSGLQLDGRPFRFAGTNNYYLEYSDAVMTDAVLSTAADRGLTVVRTWAFLDVPSATETGNKGVYFQYFDPEVGAPAFNDGADGLEKLDHVVAQAGAEGLKLILPLTNNWADFGGMDQYTKWAGGTYHSDFYSDPKIRGWYKAWVEHVLNRTNTVTGVKYKDDPTIMAWELANEPRCVGSGALPKDPSCTTDTLTAWVAEMSAYVKSVDKRHLVGTGDEGFLADQPDSEDWTRNGGEGVDAKRFAALPTIDYLSYHLYPDHWTRTADWGTTWIKDHSRIAKQVGKPAILGEFGLQDKATRNPVYKEWTDAVVSSGGAGAAYWILSDVQADGTLYPDYDGFTVYDSSPVMTTLQNFGTTIRTGKRSFAPVADDDSATTEFATPVSLPVTSNDVAYKAKVVGNSVDLDPATARRQSSVTVAGGTFTADPYGVVAFTPADGFAGRASASYTVVDTRGRRSAAATVTVTVKPSPTAPQTLFDFTDGTQGWTGISGATSGSVAAVDGALSITSNGDWFGAALTTPADLSTRSQLTFDLRATSGVSPMLALQLGPSWSWCQAAPIPWTTATGTIEFDLTTLSPDCTALLGEVHAVQLFFNGGLDTIDDVTVR